MNRFVILRIGEGSFETGFPVICQMGEEFQPPRVEQTGHLPAAPDLLDLYQNWRSHYLQLSHPLRLEPQPGQITNISLIGNCVEAATALGTALNQWLSAPEFRSVCDKLLEQLQPGDSIRLLMVTDQVQLQKLPWHLWELLERYPKAELGFSPQVYEAIPQRTSGPNGVRILAVVGDGTGLDTQTDQQLLAALPNAVVSLLVEPTHGEFNAQLWDEAWDILFFAGHSSSAANGASGQLWLNASSPLTINDLKYALRKALDAGLQLAIFNSCDGLGLAKVLADLKLPQMIVMREPIPDPVARAFLQHFLSTFAQGQAFHLAVREARERLQGMEPDFPCATWLPVIVQHPAAIPPTWATLGGRVEELSSDLPADNPLVTMVWTDLLNSTPLKQHLQGQQIGDRNQTYIDQILHPHQERVRRSINQYGGSIVKTEGDSFFIVFTDVAAALQWSIDLQQNHVAQPIPTPLGNLQVRIGIHTGRPLQSNGDYIGHEVDYLARLADLAQGSQILLSEVTEVLIRNLGFKDLNLYRHGDYLLKGIGRVPIFEVLWDHRPPQKPRLDVKALFNEGYLQPTAPVDRVGLGRSLAPPPRRWYTQTLNILLVSLYCAVGVSGLRWTGGLQSLEFWSFDRLMRLRPHEKPDDRLLVITVTAQDLLLQSTENRRSSLSDQTLLKLLQTIEPFSPSVIGLDIYRDFPVQDQFPQLAEQLRHNSKLIVVCKSRDALGDPVGVAPPNEVPATRIGFSDFIEDPDGILRRQLLFMTPEPISPCQAHYAFGTQVALRYLAAKGIQPLFTSTGDLKLGQAHFQRLQPFTGGYRSSTEGHQMLLNFRSLPSPQEIAIQVSVSDVLNHKVPANLFKDRAILIGVSANSSSDFWDTPYGAGGLQKTSGVLLQAHMVSHLLGAVLDQRPSLRVWPLWGDGLWMWGWSILSAVGIQMSHRLKQFLMLLGIVGGTLIFIGWIALIKGLWLPLVPALLAVAITGGAIGTQKLRNPQEKTRSLRWIE